VHERRAVGERELLARDEGIEPGQRLERAHAFGKVLLDCLARFLGKDAAL
jgi:hypothetical protein